MALWIGDRVVALGDLTQRTAAGFAPAVAGEPLPPVWCAVVS